MAANTEAREVRLPTPEELKRTYEIVRDDATEAVGHVAWLMREVVSAVDHDERPEFEAPTFEMIGRLYVYADDVRSRLDEMRGYVDDVTNNLITLDELRIRLADRR